MSQSRIAICLYKEEVKDFDYPKFFAGTLEQVKLKHPHKNIWLYQRKSKDKVPGWVEIISKFSKANDAELTTASSGAILVIKIKNRFLACCFGTSVANINRESLVNDFGLAAAFKRMTRTDTKSVESFSFQSNPITSQKTASIPTIRENFNIDQLNENITELEGFHKDGTARSLIKGKEFYSCKAVDTLDKIKKLCGQLLLDYQNGIRLREFQRLTATRKIKDKATIALLDGELCKNFEAGDDDIFFDDYENLSETSKYRLSDTQLVEALEWNDLSPSSKKKTIDVSYLKSKRIVPVDENGRELSSWSLYKTIFFQANIGVETFILYKGNWYQVDPSFISGLKSFVDSFYLDLKGTFPEWNGKDAEGKYSKNTSTIVTGQLWDKKLYTHPDYNYGVELCDIITKDYMMAIKAYKSSALNSHLLLQTLVAVQLLDSDSNIFSWIQTKCNTSFKGVNLIGANVAQVRAKKTIVILLLSKKKTKPSEILPFFSLISFKQVLTKIQALNFTVKVSVL
jgi:uncharacterized protein (TIGR04141 family)